ncbi:MAG TPA: ATP-binding protein [Myxococcales bacterium]|nr:ATP-binding protein [Myxococcales bacterium]
MLRPDARFQQVRRLTEVSRALTYAESPDEVLEITVASTSVLLRTEKVVLLVQERGGSLTFKASAAIRGEIRRLLQQAAGSLDEGVIGKVKAYLEHDERLRFLAVPMVIAGEVAGVLAAALAVPADADVDEEEWLLAALSDQAAVTLEKLRLHQATAVAEKARRQREEEFDTLYGSPLIGLVFKDSGGVILDANDAFVALSGYSREDLSQRALRWDEIAIRMVSPREEKHAASQTMRPYEAELSRKDGQQVEVLVGSATLQEQERDLVFVVDISAQKRAETSLRILSETSKALLGSSLDHAALFKSIAWLVVPRFADWCAVESVEDGVTSGEHIAVENLSGSSIARAVEWRRRFPPDPDSTIGVAEIIRTGRSQLHAEVPDTFLAEYVCQAEELSEMRRAGPRSAILVPMVLQSDVVGVITFVRAGTRRRFGRDDLALAEEIARRGASGVENAQLYRRAQAAIGLRDEFLSAAAHELKTPLTSLKLQLDGLQKAGARRGGEEKIEWLVSAATRQSDRLARLVDDLLDVTRITSGRVMLNREPSDLVELVRHAVGPFAERATKEGSGIDLDLPDEPIRGDWDRSRITQVIINLVGNALKYGAGKPIRVSLLGVDGVARLTVKDAGIGIAQADIPRIFDRFERAVSPRHYGGLGLGLFIAREIIVAHGGDIDVLSRPNEGAEFVIRLPLGADPLPRKR